MANIDISPERRKLQQQYNGLKKLFSELTEKRDAMDQYEGPKLCSVYLELIGQLEYERLALQVEVKTLQMRRDLLQAFINRDERPDLNAIEEKVKQAVAEYNRILAQEAERLQMAKEILNAPPLSEEESKEMRDLYRLLVKQLHPDLHPDQSDREAALFLQVQAAYKICDLYKLREIALLLDSKSLGEDNYESSYDELERQVTLLQDKVDDLKGKIDVMNSSFPFMYRDKLFEEEWVKERQEAVKNEIEELKGIKIRLQGIVDVMEEYKKWTQAS
jgi:hypothetical protein